MFPSTWQIVRRFKGEPISLRFLVLIYTRGLFYFFLFCFTLAFLVWIILNLELFAATLATLLVWWVEYVL